MNIREISEETLALLRRLQYLPDNPSGQGWKPADIKRALTEALTGETNSVVKEINRIVEEINSSTAIDDIEASVIEDIEGESSISAEAVENTLKIIFTIGYANIIDHLKNSIVDGLSSTDAKTPLSAKQGKILNEKIETVRESTTAENSLNSNSETKPLSAKQGKFLNENKIGKDEILRSIPQRNDSFEENFATEIATHPVFGSAAAKDFYDLVIPMIQSISESLYQYGFYRFKRFSDGDTAGEQSIILSHSNGVLLGNFKDSEALQAVLHPSGSAQMAQGVYIGGDVKSLTGGFWAHAVAIGRAGKVGYDSVYVGAFPDEVGEHSVSINGEAQGSEESTFINGGAIVKNGGSRSIAIGGGGYQGALSAYVGENCVAIGAGAVCVFPGGVTIRSGNVHKSSTALVELGEWIEGVVEENLNIQSILRVAGIDVLLYDRATQKQYLNPALMNIIVDALTSTETDKALSANQGRVLKGKIDALESLLESDDTDLDTLKEIIDYIKSNRTLIQNVTTNKVNVSDIVDNLSSNIATKPLSAAQGRALKLLIDAIPEWAKAVSKPTYTPVEIGAEPAFQKNSAFNKNFGNEVDTVCEGNDPRLSDARPASDVPNHVKNITSSQVAHWDNPSYTNLQNKPSINNVVLSGNLTLEDLGIPSTPTPSTSEISFGMNVGDKISSFVFNTTISQVKMNSFLAALTNSIATGMTGQNEIACILAAWANDEGIGLYSVDLSLFGGTGRCMAVCNVSSVGAFNVSQVVYVGEYSMTNETIIQNFKQDFTYSQAGWQNTAKVEFGEEKDITDITPDNTDLVNKVFAFVNKDTKIWDYLSMFN